MDEKLKTTGVQDHIELLEHEEVEAERHGDFLKAMALHKVDINNGVASSGGVSSASSASGLIPPSEPKPEGKPKLEEKEKVAIASLRKFHGQCDRTKRDYKGVIALSKVNDNTQGSKCERELDATIARIATYDDELVSMEQEFMVKGSVTDEQIKHIADICGKIKADTDAGREKANALKAWFKLA